MSDDAITDQQAMTEATAAPDTGTAEATETAEQTETPERSPFEQRLAEIMADDDEPEEEDAADAEEGAGAQADIEPDDVAETEEANADEGTADADDGAPVLRFPGRQPDDPDFEVELTDGLRAELEAQGIEPDEFLQRAGQLRNEGLRRRQFEESMQQVDADRAELDAIERELADRPAEFITGRIGDELLPDVAKAVLLRLPDDQFNALLDTMSEWDADPSVRRLQAVEAREQAAAREQERRTRRTQNTQRQGFIRDVAGQIIGLVPDDYDDGQANEFFDFAVYKLDQWARSQPRGSNLDPKQVPALLDELGALAPYGLSTHDQAARPSHKETSSAARRTRPADTELAERAKKTGQDLKRRVEKKRRAATTPAGAGAPAASLAPPKGQSFKERIGWLEQRLGLK